MWEKNQQKRREKAEAGDSAALASLDRVWGKSQEYERKKREEAEAGDPTALAYLSKIKEHGQKFQQKRREKAALASLDRSQKNHGNGKVR